MAAPRYFIIFVEDLPAKISFRVPLQSSMRRAFDAKAVAARRAAPIFLDLAHSLNVVVLLGA
jgi:hypothetical protein